MRKPGEAGPPHPAAARWMWVLWLAVFVAGCGIAWMVPPFQSPDENAHLGRAYLISRGQVLLERVEGRDPGGRFDPALADFLRIHIPMIGNAERKSLSADEAHRAGSLRWSSADTPGQFESIAGTGYYLPLIYAPQAIALAVGRWLDLTILQSYRLARGATGVAILALLMFACRVLPPNPLQAALLLLPMTLFQAVAPVIDGISAALVVFVVALFLRRACTEEPTQPAWHHWAFAATLLLLCTSRNQLLPLLGLPFFLALRHRSQRDAWTGVLLLALVGSWTLFALTTTVDTRIVRTQGTSELIRHYIGRPAEFFRIAWATVNNTVVWDSYTKMFIGVLGWLDTQLAPDWYTWLWYGLGACALGSISVSTLRQDVPERLWLLLTAGASLLLVFFALLVTWTPHPTQHVSGVQGRYFLAPLVLAAAALSGTGRVWRQWWRAIPVAAFAVASLTALLPALGGRYH